MNTVIMQGLNFLKFKILKFLVSSVSGSFYWIIQSLQQKIIKSSLKKKKEINSAGWISSWNEKSIFLVVGSGLV